MSVSHELNAFSCNTLSVTSLLPVPVRAHACLAGPHSHRDPATSFGPSVGAAGLQPDTLPHVHAVPLLSLLHADREQRGQQCHCKGVPVGGPQHLPLHPQGPATLPGGPCEAGTGQPRGQEGEPGGHISDGGGQ